MSKENSVSVHIRRGDYAASAYQSFFGMLPITYYESAIRWIRENVDQPKFYFFSDDPEWCRQHFGEPQAVFMSHNHGTQSYKDLLLMTHCKHHIIANSTFSWWGAWLGQAQGGQVLAPSRWFSTNFLDRKEPVYASRFYNTRDLLPPAWIKL